MSVCPEGNSKFDLQNRSSAEVQIANPLNVDRMRYAEALAFCKALYNESKNMHDVDNFLAADYPEFCSKTTAHIHEAIMREKHKAASDLRNRRIIDSRKINIPGVNIPES